MHLDKLQVLEILVRAPNVHACGFQVPLPHVGFLVCKPHPTTLPFSITQVLVCLLFKQLKHFISVLVTETVMNNRELQDKLARCLDRTHRVIKGWEHLACTRVINAPLEVRLRCKLKAEYSQTEKLIDILTVVHGNTELRDFCDKIKAMKRMDVLEIVKEYYSGL